MSWLELFSIYLCFIARKEKISSSACRTKNGIFTWEDLGQQMHLLNNKNNRLGDVATFEESTTKIAQSNENSLKQSMGPTNDHLDALEAQSIYIFREAFARLKKLALL